MVSECVLMTAACRPCIIHLHTQMLQAMYLDLHTCTYMHVLTRTHTRACVHASYRKCICVFSFRPGEWLCMLPTRTPTHKHAYVAMYGVPQTHTYAHTTTPTGGSSGFQHCVSKQLSGSGGPILTQMHTTRTRRLVCSSHTFVIQATCGASIACAAPP